MASCFLDRTLFGGTHLFDLTVQHLHFFLFGNHAVGMFDKVKHKGISQCSSSNHHPVATGFFFHPKITFLIAHIAVSNNGNLHRILYRFDIR